MIQRRAAALTAAAVLALTGCSDDGGDQPRPLPSLTTPSASETSAPIGIPSYDATPQGAESAVRAFYAQGDRAAATGDTSVLRQLFLPTCSFCEEGAQYIEAASAKGRLEGGETTIRAVAAIEQSSTRVVVTSQFDLAAGRLMSSSGALLEETRAVVGVQDEVTVVRMGNAWLVESIERVGLS